MKTKDVKVGASLVLVKVTGESAGAYGFGGSHDGPKRFHVARVDNGQKLPKPRTAAALRPVNRG